MEETKNISCFSIIAETCKIMFSNIFYLLYIIFIPTLLFLFIDWISISLRLDFFAQATVDPDVFAAITVENFVLFCAELLGFIKFLCFVPAAAYWHRFILLGYKSPSIWLKPEKSTLHYFKSAFILGIIYVLFFLIGAYLSSEMFELEHEYAHLLISLPTKTFIFIPLFIHILSLAIILPLGLKLPAIISDRVITFKDAWTLMGPDRIAALVNVVILTAPLLVINKFVIMIGFVHILTNTSGDPSNLGSIIIGYMKDWIWISAPFTILSLFIFLTVITIVYKNSIK